ncbi:MAG: ComEC/Rec2 family competence protein [Leptospiraceae bacterium]|nr:ComEC/Rec2 family competence protein [Leptospiraceae bacterium]
MGGLLFILYASFVQELNAKETSLTITDSDLKITDQKIHLSLKEEVKRGVYSSIVSMQSYSSKESVRWKYKEAILPEFICHKENVFFRTDYFGNRYLNFNESKCVRKEEEVDIRRKIRFLTDELLQRGKLEDVALDISLGVLFGDTSYLSKELKQKSREGGTLHLFAASGLHIGVLFGFLIFITKRIPFLNYYSEKIIPIFLCFGYLYLLRFPVSLSRAFLFACFFVGTKLVFRNISKTDLILNSCIILRILSPESYLNLSFTLSFSAVIGILFLKEELDKIILPRLTSFWKDNLTLSISASLGTFPALIYYFSSFSFGSIIINIIVIPLTSILLPILYFSIILESLQLTFLSEVFWIQAEIFLRLIARISTELGGTLGFYKEFSETRNLYILNIIFLILLLLIPNFLKKISEGKEEKKVKRLELLISFFVAIMIFSFFIIGYHISPEKKSIPRFQKIGSSYDIFKIEDKLFLKGECKYKSFEISVQLNSSLCTKELKSIHIEKSTCLAHAFSCKNQTDSNIKIVHYENPEKEFIEKFDLEVSKNQFPKIFHAESEVIFYSPIKDNLELLLKNTRSGEGIVILNLPFNSKDSAEKWNEMRTLLGISNGWKFYTRKEWIKKND